MNADEIVARRPPDRVVYEPWEPDPDSEFIHREMVAVEQTLFKVLRYEEVTRTAYRRDRRRRSEFWDAESVGRWEWEYRERANP